MKNEIWHQYVFHDSYWVKLFALGQSRNFKPIVKFQSKMYTHSLHQSWGYAICVIYEIYAIYTIYEIYAIYEIYIICEIYAIYVIYAIHEIYAIYNIYEIYAIYTIY
jgi:hypothetical protein